ncbi:glycosyltransferase family 2 protein [uncultured Bacteroides sp.]|uniref:glycosyltransferase family 2 protein n=1 Tax=uncultured Bacteroides sp. TaxID=162156 RepID=UPI00339DA57D
MLNRELVSIVTPMYNGEKYVEETINSVLQQTYSNWEMIIVDDGSKDNSSFIVEEYSKKDRRIKLLRQNNAGSSAARNNGLRHVQGRYVCFLDSDDFWEPNFLETQLKFIKEKKSAIVFSSYKRINTEGKEILKPFIVPDKVDYYNLLKSCSISCLTALYDREKTGDVLFNEAMGSMRDDFVFWLSILKKGGYAYGNPDVLASYRVFAASTTGNKKKVMKPHFMVYYKVEKLGLIRSIYYFINWAINGYFKYK